jgi:glycosyltransferase involved in cell wall biosynthesis
MPNSEISPDNRTAAASTVSVAMCTCNGEAYLREQLESILAQSLPPNELIVSDDASSDRTVEIVNSFKATCPFPVTLVVNETRLGVCKNFENAIRRCSGDVIFFADQDDVWLPSKIANIMEVFERNPLCGYVFSNADLIDESGEWIGRDLWTSIGFDKNQQAGYNAGEQLTIMLRRISLAYGLTMAFRAVFRPKVMPFECRFCSTVHDSWISFLLTSLGAYGVALPDSLVRYRQHGSQIVGAGRPLGFIDLTMNKRSSETKMNLDFADLLERLAARVRQLEPNSEAALRAREQLVEKAKHLRVRVHANSSHGFERFKTVFCEAFSGRYSRYSRSLKSIVKDLITD